MANDQLGPAMNVRHPGAKRFSWQEVLPGQYIVVIECDGTPIVQISLHDPSEEAAMRLAEQLERSANLVMTPDIAQMYAGLPTDDGEAS